MVSQSPPKRSSSKGKTAKVDKDEQLLEASIVSHKVDYPRPMLLAVGLVTGFLPCYMAHAFFSLDWLNLVNVPIFALVVGATGHLLSHAYAVMFESEFLKRQRHYQETKTEQDAAILRQLRLQVALAHAIFFINACFVLAVSVLQGYILRRLDARLNLIVSPLVTAAALWYVALKNEEARQRKVGRQ